VRITLFVIRNIGENGMLRTLIKTSLFGLALSLATFAARPASADPLTVGYSDWPGWVAWQVAIDKGWFKEAGLDVSDHGEKGYNVT
jgi:ABC-type nitrate/sulfonate/bicarbonate transport system substrate-binding protein